MLLTYGMPFSKKDVLHTVKGSGYNAFKLNTSFEIKQDFRAKMLFAIKKMSGVVVTF